MRETQIVSCLVGMSFLIFTFFALLNDFFQLDYVYGNFDNNGQPPYTTHRLRYQPKWTGYFSNFALILNVHLQFELIRICTMTTAYTENR